MKPCRSALFVIILPVLCGFSVFSQQPYLKYYNLNSGFPHAQVWNIFQDRHGQMWFATAGGLVKYDGVDYTAYTKDDGLISNVVRTIFQDDDGKLWLSTDDGISIFDGHIFRNFYPDTAKESGTLWSILKDRNADYWFASERGRIVRWDGRTMSASQTHYHESNRYRFGFADRQANLWFCGTLGADVIYYRNGSYDSVVTHFSVKDGYFEGGILEATEDWKGRILFATSAGLVIFDRDKAVLNTARPLKSFFSSFGKAEGLGNSRIKALTVSYDSSIWLATEHGFSRFKNQTFTNYLADENYASNSCQAIFEDRENILWIGTDGGGVIKVPFQNIFNFTIKDGLSFNVVNAVTGDRQGRIYIGTDNGVERFDGKTMTTITPRFTPGNTVWSLKMDSKDRLWIGTENDLFEYREGKLIPHSEIYSIARSQILDIEEDEKGDLWFGTLNGLVVWNGRSGRLYNKDNGLPANPVWCVFRDAAGAFWLGINGGLTRATADPRTDSLTFKTWTTADGLMDNTVNVIRQDPSGNYWIGTDLGISCFDGSRFYNIKAKAIGLGDNIVPAMEMDVHSGLFWIGSKGYGRFKIGNHNLVLDKLLTKNRGMLIDESTTNNALYIDPSNNVWIGSFGGLTLYSESLQRPSDARPPVIISKVRMEDSTLLPNLLGPDMNSDYEMTSHTITFEFRALSFLDEKDNTYEYFLEGFDKHRSEFTGKNEVRYTNLSPGRYVFSVRAKNCENAFSEQPAVFTFVVPTPLWLRWYVLLFAAGAALYGAYGIYRLRVNRKLELFHKRNRQLEILVEQRTQQITKQKESLEELLNQLRQTQTQLVQSEKMSALGQLVAGVAHEINNPTSVLAGNVTYIEDYVGTLRKMISKYEEIVPAGADINGQITEFKKSIDYEFILNDLDTLIGSIKHASDRIRHIVLDLRNFSRLDEAELNEVNIHDCIETTVKLFMSQYRHLLSISNDFHATRVIYCYINQINQVLLNLLLNAAQAIEGKFLHSPSSKVQGLITITTADTVNGISVTIRDNGIGIPETIRGKVFDPFFTTKPVGQGTGLGLSISYSIIEKHHGTIHVESVEDQGSAFTFTLPFKPHAIPS